MYEETNKYGVPYHSFTMVMDDTSLVDMNIGCEEDWGDVNEFLDHTGHRGIGWGNDDDGYDEIVMVIDGETNENLDPREWFDQFVVPYVENYSC